MYPKFIVGSVCVAQQGHPVQCSSELLGSRAEWTYVERVSGVAEKSL